VDVGVEVIDWPGDLKGVAASERDGENAQFDAIGVQSRVEGCVFAGGGRERDRLDRDRTLG
jgi:hypothetical protein